MNQAPFRLLRAGSLSVQYLEGSLRYIRFGEREILRQVYFATRDRDWGTVPLRVASENIEESAAGFRIDIAAGHVAGDVDFRWSGRIEGTSDSTIRWSVRGEAHSSFWRNRIGFCVLHPIRECAGNHCVVEHASGAAEQSRFPQFVAPHQPFLDVRAISHQVVPGLVARVVMEGDVFETEDHRNWTDQSFKTYSTPLTVLYPEFVAAGQIVEQSVELQLLKQPTLEIHSQRICGFPALDHVRVDLQMTNSNWRDKLNEAPSGPLELAVYASGGAEFAELARELEQAPRQVARVLVFGCDGRTTPLALVNAARQALGPRMPVGGGSDTSFAEWNRNRGGLEALDFLSWAISPQVHALDQATLIENLEGQRSTVEAARQVSGGRPIAISPVRLRDCSAAFTEAWLVGSLKQLAESGVNSITYPMTSDVLARVVEFAPDSLYCCTSSDPLAFDAIVLSKGSRRRILLANFRNEPQTIAITGEAAPVMLAPYEVRQIDRESR